MKDISTLVPDVYKLISEGASDISDNAYDKLGEAVKEAVKFQLTKAFKENNPTEGDVKKTLRMSNVGKPDKYLWYLQRQSGTGTSNANVFSPAKLFSFMYGAIIEEVMLWLAEQSGHRVENRQHVVDVEGVEGHMDCRIDGIGIDVKSASNQSFMKFKGRKILQDDPFGYMHQLGGYFPGEDAGFFVANKETGDICLTLFDKSDIPCTPERIKHIKELATKDEPPPQCYNVKQIGRNKGLPIGCKGCPFKLDCWKGANDGQGLRAFRYADGLEYLTEVVSEPRVDEVDVKDGQTVIKKGQQSEEESFPVYPQRT